MNRADIAPSGNSRSRGRADSRLVTWVLGIYVFMLAYASLAPFEGWQRPQGYTLFDWPRYVTGFDVVINIVAYFPLGAIIGARLRHPLREIEFDARNALTVLALATAAGFAISALLELCQAFLPGRVSSPLDVLTNTAGTALGAIIVLLPVGRRAIQEVAEFRLRHFSLAPLTDWGLLLLVLWLAAQLNPAIPFFEAGLLADQGPTSYASTTVGYSAAATYASSYDPLVLLPQAVGVALNVAAFALFVSVLTPATQSRLLTILAILSVGFTAKLAMASLLLKAPQLVSSLSPATVVGVTSGLIVQPLFTRLSYRWLAFWAALFVFGGGVMAKLASVYAALDQALRLFNWPHGQLANFASLTRWINEVWPILALGFLAAVFMSKQSESR